MRARALLSFALLTAGCSLDLSGGDSPPGGDTGLPGGDDDPGPHPCCEPHGGPECDNPILSMCVCEADPACCEQSWDAHCVAQVEALGCGQCGPSGSCCEARDDPGCDVPALQTCVCDVDPHCCEDGWDPQCVADVFLFDCGVCPGTTGCCVADGVPGCSEPDVAGCVCAQDPACCATGWDFQCVQEVETLGCGTCSMPTSGGSGTAGSGSGSGTAGR